MNRTWFDIKNVADSDAEIYLYDEIGGYGIGAKDFNRELRGIDADAITVHINSVGGSVFEGFAIYQALRDHPATVTVVVDALAASIASVIAMAGDEVVMASNAEMMIHDGMAGAQGNAADLAKLVETLDRVSNNIASVYAERSGAGNSEDWRELMRAETWFSADEAVEVGLADRVLAKAPRKARNVAELAIFNYAGRRFAPAPHVATPTNKDSDPEWDTDLIVKALEGAFDD